jgi:putative transposase
MRDGLYLAVLVDVLSRQGVGWLMQSRIDRELVLRALALGGMAT